jgi:hypothetical protein
MLPEPVVVVEAKVASDVLLALLDAEMLEDVKLEAEVESDVMDDDMLLEALLAAVEGVELAVVAGELCAAELGNTTDPVLVCCSPTTPMMVCAVPSETWNVPSPVLQSHVPSALSGWQHQLLLPHDMTEPLLDDTGSSIKNPN